MGSARTGSNPVGVVFLAMGMVIRNLCLLCALRVLFAQISLVFQLITVPEICDYPRGSVSEWLRSRTRNPMGSARGGSNPLAVAFFVVIDGQNNHVWLIGDVFFKKLFMFYS